jgi:hypothetical protein
VVALRRRARGSYSNFLIQPFVDCTFPGGTYVNPTPTITATGKADSGKRWTVPLGLGVGRTFRSGEVPANTQIGAYCRGETGLRRELATALAGAIHVSETTWRSLAETSEWMACTLPCRVLR